MADRRVYVVQLGLVPYGEALELQRHVAEQVISGSIDGDVLLLLEHPPVVTLGRSTKLRNLVASPDFLASRGVELFEVERGGDVTFHGLGQLVGYPIVDLKASPHKRDLHWYLRQVEEVLIRALGAVGIAGTRNAGYTGVWVDSHRTQAPHTATEITAGFHALEGDADAAGAMPPTPSRKIASIGVHARDWVTWHGFAINVTTDLSFFDLIVPCGIQGVEMTTLERELCSTRGIGVAEFGEIVVQAWREVFGVAPEPRSRQDLPVNTVTASQPTG